MSQITFNDLPQAVMTLLEKLENIEKTLQNPQSAQPLEDYDFLTVEETCVFLNLAKPTIYGLVRDAKIPFCKRGRRLYFSRKSLADWIMAGRKKTSQELDDDAASYLANLKWGRN